MHYILPKGENIFYNVICNSLVQVPLIRLAATIAHQIEQISILVLAAPGQEQPSGRTEHRLQLPSVISPTYIAQYALTGSSMYGNTVVL